MEGTSTRAPRIRKDFCCVHQGRCWIYATRQVDVSLILRPIRLSSLHRKPSSTTIIRPEDNFSVARATVHRRETRVESSGAPRQGCTHGGDNAPMRRRWCQHQHQRQQYQQQGSEYHGVASSAYIQRRERRVSPRYDDDDDVLLIMPLRTPHLRRGREIPPSVYRSSSSSFCVRLLVRVRNSSFVAVS